MRITFAVLIALLATDVAVGQYVDGNEEFLVAQMYIRRTLVVIHDRTDWTQGSGFFVREDNDGYSYVVTNAHVVPRGNNIQIDVYPHGSIDVRDSVEVLASDQSRDLALIRFKTSLPTPCLTVRRIKGQSLRSQLLLAAGFPHHKLSFKQYTTISDRVSEGTYSSDFFEISANFGAGGSGSPVIGFTKDEKLQVVGVIHARRGSRGVACYKIAEFLRDSGYQNLVGDGVPSSQRASQASSLISIMSEQMGR